VIHVSTTQAGAKPEVIGTTETIANTLSPNWASVFVIDIELGKPLIVAVQVQVYDQVKKGRGGARGNTKALTGTNALALDEEAPTKEQTMIQNVLQLCVELREDEYNDKTAEVPATALASLVLKSSPETGIQTTEMTYRQQVFGRNALAERKPDSFCKLCYDAVQDFVLIVLIVLDIISIVAVMTYGLDPGGTCGACWIEGAAILMSVCIVVLVTAGIDYAKQFAFLTLTKSLHETNTKVVPRNGVSVSIIDDDIVVGDIVSVNLHSLASIPADCDLLGTMAGLKVDESTLTGKSKLIVKRPGDVVLSGKSTIQGSGKMIVIAVGSNSVSCKIRACVNKAKNPRTMIWKEIMSLVPYLSRWIQMQKSLDRSGRLVPFMPLRQPR